MANKQMMFDTGARAEISAGMSQLSKAVKATLGPRGRNVGVFLSGFLFFFFCLCLFLPEVSRARPAEITRGTRPRSAQGDRAVTAAIREK